MPARRTVIFAGGELSELFLRELDDEDFIIGADKGALFLVAHGVIPDIAVGDFDSITQEEFRRIEEQCPKVIACDPVDKDLTDSELALDLALKQQPEDILLFGVTGTRLDQTLASIQMMTRVLQRQISCSIMDLNNYVTITGSQALVQERGYTYVSLLPVTPEVTGITLEGFQYPLTDATLKLGQSLGISNRLVAPTGTVTILSGLLLIIQSKD
ncbi:thiamine pyrophosphokinase [Paenibacillus forsythiae]|uniref:Thiamine diphosphokinase n=1 Tax=Paenibacillus forsythiae TaxID=365616 RepID=A0ABU3H1J2_9BACL|nr:thiamine diphosphokinase [Paenibacillus forsythiae]MDT3424688.1 thiamine pyrophosphokinase [Paenibacillus forsythiae]